MLSRNSIIAAAAVLFSVMMNHAQAQFQPGEFTTYSQESWGSYPPPSSAAQLLGDRFDSVYIGGAVEVGISGSGGSSMFFTEANAIWDYLPADGAPATLDTDLLNPTSTLSGVFGGYVLALQINVDFDDDGELPRSAGIPFGDLMLFDLQSSEFNISALNGLTVRQFLDVANTTLGGGASSYDLDGVSYVNTLLTEAFENGSPRQFAQDHLRIAIPGDYNLNGTVEAADFTVWRDHLGQTFSLSNENPAAATPGVVDAEDYAFWKSRFGETAGSGSGATSLVDAAVPEPSVAVLLLGVCAFGRYRRRS